MIYNMFYAMIDDIFIQLLLFLMIESRNFGEVFKKINSGVRFRQFINSVG